MPNQRKKFRTRQMAFDALLIAAHYVLSLFSISAGPMKFTLEGFPILLGALLFGPVDGAVIGFLGAFLAQILGPYGFMPTTLLWVLPHFARGLVAGLYARARGYQLGRGRMIFLMELCAVLTTVLNTLALLVDSRIGGYYSYQMVFGSLIWRFLTGMVLALLYAAVLPALVSALRRQFGTKEEKN